MSKIQEKRNQLYERERYTRKAEINMYSRERKRKSYKERGK